MIGNIKGGNNFGQLFRYLLAEDKDARIIGGKAAGKKAQQLTQEFNHCAAQRPTTNKPVKHLIISFASEDGYVEDSVKVSIAAEVVEGLSYTNNQYIVVSHGRNDPGHDWNHNHDHIHIALNMVTIDGKRINDWQDYPKFEAILREQEKQHNLTPIALSKTRERKAPSHGQVRRYKKEWKEYVSGQKDYPPEPILTIKLQRMIDIASKDKPSITTFIGRLQQGGVDVRPYINSEEGIKGITYQIEGLKPIRGSKLHNASLTKLFDKRGISFDRERDLSAIEPACRNKSVVIPRRERINWSQIEIEDFYASSTDVLPKLEIRAKQRFQSKKNISKQQEWEL